MSEPLAHSIVNSLNTSIAVINRAGRIVLVNEAWTRFARENGDPEMAASGVGTSYLAVTQRASQAGDALAGQALAGIEAVLAGRTPSFQLKYPCHSPTHDRWYLMVATPHRASGGGAVIAHIEIASAMTGVRPSATGDERRLHVRYQLLLERALRVRSFGLTSDCSADAREVARLLVWEAASPWDVMELHQRTLEALCRKLSADQVATALDEARLVLLRVLGYMAEGYRSAVLSQAQPGAR